MKTIKMIYFTHRHAAHHDRYNVRGMFTAARNNTLVPRFPICCDPVTNMIIEEQTFLPDTIYKLEQVREHLRPSVGQGMIFADDNQYLNGGVHAIMSSSNQPAALYKQYIITGLKCNERVTARNLNNPDITLVIGTTHMAMALPTYARADHIGQIHDLVVDTSGFDEEQGTISPEVVGRIIQTFMKLEPDAYGANAPTLKYKIHWIDGRYREYRHGAFHIIHHISWVSMKGGLLPW